MPYHRRHRRRGNSSTKKARLAAGKRHVINLVLSGLEATWTSLLFYMKNTKVSGEVSTEKATNHKGSTNHQPFSIAPIVVIEKQQGGARDEKKRPLITRESLIESQGYLI